MILHLDKTYTLRNGRRVYAAELHYCDPDIMIGYGDDGIYHHFNRVGGTSRLCFGYSGGPVLNDPSIDIVGEAMGLNDLRDEHLAYQAHNDERRRVLKSLTDEEYRIDHEAYEKWCREHRPPGPLRPGMRASDYEVVQS